MKKLILIILPLLLCFSLSSCGFLTSQNDRRFVASALGFTAKKDTVTVAAEIIIVNSELSESEPTPTVITATGKTIDEAIDNISLSISRPLLLEHCGIIAIGDEMNDIWFDKICDYCINENRITLSAYMISCQNPEMLLSLKPESSVAIGYDIMGIIEQNEKTSDTPFNNRFFEIEALRKNGEPHSPLPRFEIKSKRISLARK